MASASCDLEGRHQTMVGMRFCFREITLSLIGKAFKPCRFEARADYKNGIHRIPRSESRKNRPLLWEGELLFILFKRVYISHSDYFAILVPW
jgi:hypothetical protein